MTLCPQGKVAFLARQCLYGIERFAVIVLFLLFLLQGIQPFLIFGVLLYLKGQIAQWGHVPVHHLRTIYVKIYLVVWHEHDVLFRDAQCTVVIEKVVDMSAISTSIVYLHCRQ